MELIQTLVGDTQTLQLGGRLDATTARDLDRDWVAEGVRQLTVDLQQCEYVSSAGLRIFMRLQREANAKGASLVLSGVGPAVYEVLDLTGLTKLFDVRRQAREISLDGLEFLSAGLCGQVFRLDAETIVKVYNPGVAPSVAEQEKEFARAAFVAGVPTALSYDVVRCGERTGVMYEMLDAVQLSALIRQNPHAVGHYARVLAEIARTFHSKTADAAIFPDLKARLADNIRDLAGLFPEEDIALLASRLELIPASDTLVHFDLHTSNIMMRGDEPIVIDMGDVSRGHYLFDLGVLAMIFGYEASGSSEFVTKVPNAVGRQLFEHFLDAYFADTPAEERAFFERNQAFLSSLRLINAISFLPYAREELVGKVRDQFLPLIRQESQVHGG
jgi:uncharacterized protein (TIGR02172 family)